MREVSQQQVAMKSAYGPDYVYGKQQRARATLREIVQQTLLRAQEGHLSVVRQALEMLVLRTCYGLGPRHYHIARYWRSELPWTFKTGFWPYKKFRSAVNEINSPLYQKLSQHKVCEKAILQLQGIPTPRFVGRLHNTRGICSSGRRLTGPDVLNELLKNTPDLDRLCFKPVEGYGGKGFQAVEVIREEDVMLRILDSQRALSVADFLSSVLAFEENGDYLIEEYLEQHPELARLNPSSVNTVRIWVCCIGGESSVLGAFLRVGRRGSLVDNTSRGAQIFRLDHLSGVVGDGMEWNIHNDTFQCHQDSGERISGTILPYWPETLALAQQAVRAFPHIKFAGLDIAYTESGPAVIELNVEPDPEGAIIFDRPHRELMCGFRTITE